LIRFHPECHVPQVVGQLSILVLSSLPIVSLELTVVWFFYVSEVDRYDGKDAGIDIIKKGTETTPLTWLCHGHHRYCMNYIAAMPTINGIKICLYVF
jgi:hypothetical protein